MYLSCILDLSLAISCFVYYFIHNSLYVHPSLPFFFTHVSEHSLIQFHFRLSLIITTCKLLLLIYYLFSYYCNLVKHSFILLPCQRRVEVKSHQIFHAIHVYSAITIIFFVPLFTLAHICTSHPPPFPNLKSPVLAPNASVCQSLDNIHISCFISTSYPLNLGAI